MKNFTINDATIWARHLVECHLNFRHNMLRIVWTDFSFLGDGGIFLHTQKRFSSPVRQDFIHHDTMLAHSPSEYSYSD